MKTNLTELVFILDRSGSMGGLESDTIGGFNSMLAKHNRINSLIQGKSLDFKGFSAFYGRNERLILGSFSLRHPFFRNLNPTCEMIPFI